MKIDVSNEMMMLAEPLPLATDHRLIRQYWPILAHVFGRTLSTGAASTTATGRLSARELLSANEQFPTTAERRLSDAQLHRRTLQPGDTPSSGGGSVRLRSASQRTLRSRAGREERRQRKSAHHRGFVLRLQKRQ